MLIIGLTGGIASGKSTVARMLEEKGVQLLDADRIAREAVEPGRPAWQEIVDWLGPSILLPDRTIDRAKLGNLVFKDRKMLKRLNKIVHPWVGAQFMSRSEKIRQEDPDAVLVYDIPLLIEAGMQNIVDLVLLVYVPREIQIARLMQRDKLTHAEAVDRVDSQMLLDEKVNYADAVVDNSGSLSETANQVEKFWANRETYRKRKKR